MTRLARRASLVVVLFFALLTFAWVSPAAADNSCVSLRTFTLEERGKFEERYGVEWWKALGLIPGPAQPGDWVERPSGDSSRMLYMPQQFWDLRSCVAAPKSAGPSKSMPNTTDPTRHRSSVADRLQELKRLHDQRLITDEEYEAKRRQILDEM
jgi:Short C-terminal domain